MYGFYFLINTAYSANIHIYGMNLIREYIQSKIASSMIRKYHYHKLQANPWHHEKESQNNHKTNKVIPALSLSLPHQDNCKTRTDIR